MLGKEKESGFRGDEPSHRLSHGSHTAIWTHRHTFHNIRPRGSAVASRRAAHAVAGEPDVVHVHLAKEEGLGITILLLEKSHAVKEVVVAKEISRLGENHKVPVPCEEAGRRVVVPR